MGWWDRKNRRARRVRSIRPVTQVHTDFAITKVLSTTDVFSALAGNLNLRYSCQLGDARRSPTIGPQKPFSITPCLFLLAPNWVPGMSRNGGRKGRGSYLWDLCRAHLGGRVIEAGHVVRWRYVGWLLMGHSRIHGRAPMSLWRSAVGRLLAVVRVEVGRHATSALVRGTTTRVVGAGRIAHRLVVVIEVAATTAC